MAEYVLVVLSSGQSLIAQKHNINDAEHPDSAYYVWRNPSLLNLGRTPNGQTTLSTFPLLTFADGPDELDPKDLGNVILAIRDPRPETIQVYEKDLANRRAQSKGIVTINKH